MLIVKSILNSRMINELEDELSFGSCLWLFSVHTGWNILIPFLIAADWSVFPYFWPFMLYYF